MEIIWASVNIDHGTRLELYKILSNLGANFRGKEIKFIISKLKEVSLKNLGSEEIDLVKELSRRSRSSQGQQKNENAESAVIFMQEIIFSSSD